MVDQMSMPLLIVVVVILLAIAATAIAILGRVLLAARHRRVLNARGLSADGPADHATSH